MQGRHQAWASLWSRGPDWAAPTPLHLVGRELLLSGMSLCLSPFLAFPLHQGYRAGPWKPLTMSADGVWWMVTEGWPWGHCGGGGRGSASESYLSHLLRGLSKL